MAGDWIKVEHVTPDKPEVIAMASALSIDQDAVFGKLIRLWIWADQQSVNGHALSVTGSFIDRLVCHAGFASALSKCSWLIGSDGSYDIPNFDRHNGETAKKRAVDNKRQVQNRSRSQRDNIVTREEKSLVGRKVGMNQFPFLKEVETEHLKHISAVVGIHRKAHFDNPRQFPSDEQTLLNFIGAAVRAIQNPSKNLEMFCGIVRKRTWDCVNGDQGKRAREMLISHRQYIDAERANGREPNINLIPLCDERKDSR